MKLIRHDWKKAFIDEKGSEIDSPFSQNYMIWRKEELYGMI
jgi:hypothetical protein